MSYSKTLQVKRLDATIDFPVNTEWNTFKQGLIDSGKIIKYELSSFNENNIATITYVLDSEQTWNEISQKSESLGDWHSNFVVT